jgi:hypothetical protein
MPWRAIKMPEVKVTGMTITTIWDDESRSDIEIKSGSFDDSGDYVSITDDNQTIYLKSISWPEIRDQIQSIFDQNEEEP